MKAGRTGRFVSIVTVIVILAMIFALLALRLYSVLGKRTGHEQQLPAPADDRPALAPAQPRAVVDARPDTARIGESLLAPEAQNGIRALIAADRAFDVNRFVSGARTAYGMVLEAFWKGDRDQLRALCDPEVEAAFAAAIAEREAAGHVLDNRLVRIDTARITDATVENGTAHLTMLFEADIAAITRDKDGTIIAGSLEDAVATREYWTFARDLKSRKPDWMLVATDEA